MLSRLPHRNRPRLLLSPNIHCNPSRLHQKSKSGINLSIHYSSGLFVGFRLRIGMAESEERRNDAWSRDGKEDGWLIAEFRCVYLESHSGCPCCSTRSVHCKRCSFRCRARLCYPRGTSIASWDFCLAWWFPHWVCLFIGSLIYRTDITHLHFIFLIGLITISLSDRSDRMRE